MPFIDGMLKVWNSVLPRHILDSSASMSHFGLLSVASLNLFFFCSFLLAILIFPEFLY